MVEPIAPKPQSFDTRQFIRLDHGMPENRKVVGLSDAAFRLYIEAICWCSRQEEDGELPIAVMLRLGSRKSATELLHASLLALDTDRYEIHDYLDFQRSSAEINTTREARGIAGTLGNHQRWHVARRKRDDTCEYCLKRVTS